MKLSDGKGLRGGGQEEEELEAKAEAEEERLEATLCYATYAKPCCTAVVTERSATRTEK